NWNMMQRPMGGFQQAMLPPPMMMTPPRMPNLTMPNLNMPQAMPIQRATPNFQTAQMNFARPQLNFAHSTQINRVQSLQTNNSFLVRPSFSIQHASLAGINRVPGVNGPGSGIMHAQLPPKINFNLSIQRVQSVSTNTQIV